MRDAEGRLRLSGTCCDKDGSLRTLLPPQWRATEAEGRVSVPPPPAWDQGSPQGPRPFPERPLPAPTGPLQLFSCWPPPMSPIRTDLTLQGVPCHTPAWPRLATSLLSPASGSGESHPGAPGGPGPRWESSVGHQGCPGQAPTRFLHHLTRL